MDLAELADALLGDRARGDRDATLLALERDERRGEVLLPLPSATEESQEVKSSRASASAACRSRTP